ncbi:hypothetical protein [Devosia sp. 1635]|uniref:hypothetical protein n=1 Tax=Devosia sp. 1635 TaxID=2726066 RepID=UPI001565738F|nr:hypothetical protein [Devosia sp. 1635]
MAPGTITTSQIISILDQLSNASIRCEGIAMAAHALDAEHHDAVSVLAYDCQAVIHGARNELARALECQRTAGGPND